MSKRLTTPISINALLQAFVFPALEFALVVLFCWTNSVPWLPGRLGSSPLAATLINSTPLILFLGWLSLYLRRARWQSLGLKRPRSWKRTVMLGVGGGLTYYYVSSRFIEPLVVRLGGPFNVAGFFAIKGHPAVLLEFLCLAWTYGAFLEELAYRGYLMNRLANLFGETAIGWALSLLLVAILFGYAHSPQGISGMIDTGIGGLIFGSVYLLDKRNLWTPILLHGTFDTLTLVRMFQGRL